MKGSDSPTCAIRAGDRRSINWRARARGDVLVVNERHPERNADVILLLDTFADARTGGRSTLDLAVRATATLASRYLERRDRVGLVSFGGVLRWLTPGMGVSQGYRIVDALLASEIVFNYAWKDISIIPARILPPQALVIAVTPLLDDRIVEALADLRARKYDLAIVEFSGRLTAGELERTQLAYRLWLLRREEIRSATRALASRWRPGATNGPSMQSSRGEGIPRHARLARVAAGAASVLVGRDRLVVRWSSAEQRGTSSARTSSSA